MCQLKPLERLQHKANPAVGTTHANKAQMQTVARAQANNPEARRPSGQPLVAKPLTGYASQTNPAPSATAASKQPTPH